MSAMNYSGRRASSAKSLRGWLKPVRGTRPTPDEGPDKASPPKCLQGKRILIVDDDAVLLKALTLKLESKGFQVTTAADGSEAIKAVRETGPELILLDLNFPPDMGYNGTRAWDGFLILSWLRRMEARTIPVIVMTGGDPAKYQDAALAAGAVSFFQKPVEPSNLLAGIECALTREENRGSGSDAEFQI